MGRSAVRAVERPSGDGFIILDNSDWLPATTAFLRNGCTSTTPFFLNRNVHLVPAGTSQPSGGPGSIRLRDPSADT